MNLLLDTHVFIWWDSEPGKLSGRALELCEDSGNTLVLSTGSLWEIQIKCQLGKIKLGKPLREIVGEQEEANKIKTLSVEDRHVYELDNLPLIHKDPFDRIIVAQAICEGFKLISHDNKLSQYPVDIEW